MKKLVLLSIAAACAAALVGCGASVGHDASITAQPSAFVPSSEKSRVILLAGEENCLGFSYADRLRDGDMRTDVSEEKYREYVRGYDNVKISYENMRKKDSALTKSDGFVDVAIGQGAFSPETGGAFGPELGLAEYLAHAYPDETSYIIKYAACAPSSCDLQWSVNGGTHYAEMTEFFSRELDGLRRSGVQPEVSAFMFVQGESDARYHADAYMRGLTELADGVRAEFDMYAPENGIAFIDASVPQYYIGSRGLNEIKNDFAQSDKRNYYVDTVVAGLDTELDNMDRKHYDAISMLALGNLLGRAFTESLVFERKTDFFVPIADAEFVDNDVSGGYALDAFCDGSAASSKWRFNSSASKTEITVDVADEFVTKRDGVKTELVLSEDEILTVISTADGRAVVTTDGRELDATDLGITSEIAYFGAADKLTGYRITLVLPFGEASISFSLINANESVSTRAFAALGAIAGKPSTYMTVKGGALCPGDHAAHGAVLGNGGPLKASYGWNLSGDDGVNGFVYMTECYPENMLYFRDVCAPNVYAEASFSIDGVANNELFPKFGIKITTRNNSGFFYYVDAAVTGGVPTGVNLGYSTFTRGAYNNDWTMLDETAGDSSSAYLFDNYIKLAIRRRGDTVTLYCNDREIATLTDNVCGLGLSDGFVSVASFNMRMRIKDYRIIPVE